MREVSCRVFSTFYGPLAERGIPLERILDGTPVSLARLRDFVGQLG